MESGVIMSKKKKSREQSTPEKEPIVQNDNSILLPILYALLAAVGAFTVVMAAGIAITAANHSSQVLAESPPPAPVQTTYEGIYQSSYTYYRELAAAREAAKTAEPTPPAIPSSEPTQEPQAPAPSTKPTNQATSTTTPQPTARATANPTSAPQTPPPAQSSVPTAPGSGGGQSGESGNSSSASGYLPSEENGTSYVLNWNTMKFHYPSCNDVSRIRDEHRQDYVGNRDTLISQAFSPCGHCNP